MSILERKDIFTVLGDLEAFKSAMKKYYEHTFNRHGFIPSVSDSRLIETHERWTRDNYRVSDIELKGAQLDHFKHCGHLAYWLRRSAPVTALFRDDEFDQNKLPPQRAQNLILRYTNEVTAFDVGFRICRYFETKRTDTPRNMALALGATGQAQLASELAGHQTVRSVSQQNLSFDYVEVMGSFLKTKNVSPHAMYLIYKSLFFPLLVFEEDWRNTGSIGK